MANRDIVTRSGKAAELSATDHDQNINGLHGTVEEQTGATYTVIYTDQGKTIELNNSAMVCTLTLIATIQGQIDTDNFLIRLKNTNATSATVSATGVDTIDGTASVTLIQNETITLQTNASGTWSIISRAHAATITADLIGNVTGDVTGDVTGTAGAAVKLVDSSGDNALTTVATAGTIANNVVVTNNTTGLACKLSASEANSNLDLSRNGTGDITVDSVPIYGMIVLDTPYLLFANTSTSSTSQTNQAITAAKTGSETAVKAILRVQSDGLMQTSSDFEFLIGEPSETLTTATHQATYLMSSTRSSDNNTVHVNLNGSEQFAYESIVTGTVTFQTTQVYVVGYYV